MTDAPPPSTPEPTPPSTSKGPVDLVLEGGGVKGIALVGAVEAITRAGYVPARVAGTSAGAVVGALVAAMVRRGESLDGLTDVARTLDYRRFRDRGRLASALVRVPLVGGGLGTLADALAIALHDGAYRGDYLRDWVRGVLAEYAVHTFGDLRRDDPGGDGSLHHRYGLVVVASDLSRHREVRLPWDYSVYGRDPDEQLVCDAVRASASTPYLFRPVQLSGAHGTATLVDGGLISNYPIDIFDRTDHRASRWPTIGVTLDGGDDGTGAYQPVRDPVDTGIAIIETAIEGCQEEHVRDPCNRARTIRVDTRGVSSFDFDLTDAQQQVLLGNGTDAATRFLGGWDFATWTARCRPEPAAQTPQA